MTDVKKIAERIKYLREVLKMSIDETAKATKVSVAEYIDAMSFR